MDYINNIEPEKSPSELEYNPYKDGKINCEAGRFGDYSVSTQEFMEVLKKQATSFFSNHHGWSAEKVARKVAEKFKLKKFDGNVNPLYYKQTRVNIEEQKNFERLTKLNEKTQSTEVQW